MILGAAEECARLLAAAATPTGATPLQVAREIHAAGGKIPGFGHPLHRPLDPRAERILELADERGVSGRARRARARAARRRRRDVGQAADAQRLAADRRGDARPRLLARVVKAVPILARTASLLAHLAEEQEQPIGFLIAARAEEAIDYRDD